MEAVDRRFAKVAVDSTIYSDVGGLNFLPFAPKGA
jgi:hypothetical protein